MAKVAASILSADFARLGEQVRAVEPYADLIHVDCMDAHFVPPLTIGPVVVQSLRPVTGLPLHCHLMVAKPGALLEAFAEAGADIITFHIESSDDPAKVIAATGTAGMRAGIGLNPQTAIEDVFPHLDELDNVIVMTLESTGYAGQPFQDASLEKVEALRTEIDRRGLEVDVVVDGGINAETGARCLAAGATVLAAASSIFKADDPAAATRALAEVARAGETV
ncbi:MAG TPA: ribulose-phosphate 3-epimerase [Actinomycetota bacterium]|nr:ribulose-phosphate 3-epimerase [Actinomycetota bacterium]